MNTRTSVGGWLVVVLGFGMVAAACGDSEPGPPCLVTGFVESIASNAADKVDLLFMVDNSGSMAEEQASLGMELPRLVRVLTSGDRTGDGASADDSPPVRSLHVGIVTSDMGVGGFNVPTCTRAAMFGDDGLLRTAGATSIVECAATYPRFLEYEPGISPQTPEQFGADFRCIATTGTTGCGFEQQLEATLKAITPASSPLTFVGDTRGHGDVENVGFIRPDSVLALVLVTDEEDCSIQAGFEGIFDSTPTSAYTGDLNLRCFNYKEAQWPVQRYIEGFKALRTGREALLVFGAITGVPLDLVQTGTPDYARILADPRMVEAVDTSPGATGARLVPSCNVPGRGIAFPPRRIVEVAEGFGNNGIIQSICQDNFSGALDAIVAKIADALGNVCLPRRLNPGATGLVPCDIVEVIPPPGTFEGQPTSCADLNGVSATPTRRNPDGSIECKVIQLATVGGMPAAGEGWYYDDFSPATLTSCGATGQRIAFTPGATPPNGVNLLLECLEIVLGHGGTEIQAGTFCDPASDICPSAAGMTLVCEPYSRTCQVSCATTADCPSSLACDLSSGSGFCLNPACGE